MTIDPSYDFPLPIVGINYLDFEFLGKKQQLALLFGGVLALANVQHPKILGPKVDASLDLFAIAVPVNDQVYDTGGEVRGERLRDHPVLDRRQPGLAVHRLPEAHRQLPVPLRPLLRGRARPRRASRSPTSTVTNGFGLAYEYKRKGYSLGGNAFAYRRGSWRVLGHGRGLRSRASSRTRSTAPA